MNPLALLKYWREILLGLALVWGGVEHTWRVTLQRDAASFAAKQVAAILEQQNRADTLSGDLTIAETSAMANDRKKETVYVDRIVTRPATPDDEACARSAAMRDANEFVHDTVAGPGGGAPADGAAPAVPRP